MAKRSFEEKTEKPTERRRRQARREGNQAKSAEVGVAFSLVTALIAFKVFAPSAMGAVAERTQAILSGAGRGIAGSGLGVHVLAMLAAALLPFLIIMLAAGLTTGISQVGFTFAPKALKPKMTNLKKGLGRFKPSAMGWELARSTLKLGLLAAVMWPPMAAFVESLTADQSLKKSLATTGDQIWGLFIRAAVLAVLVAAADYSVNKRRKVKEMKLTRTELKEEMKHAEGDSTLKQRRRRRHAQMSRNRMIAEVGQSDVVVTNPTRLAVALVYEHDEPAPVVVAKGANRMAARIRAEAYRNGVAVVEQKQLARSLFRTTQVGQYVPTALFEAVAVVLAAVYRRRRVAA